jgi:hypothetical protein
MTEVTDAPWYKDKAKVASVLVAGGFILTTLASVLTGKADWISAGHQLTVEVASILAVFHVSDTFLI